MTRAAPTATFQLQFPANQIESLASRFPPLDESRLLAVGAAARRRGHYTRREFIEICAWKSVRSRPTVAANSAARVARTTARTFAAHDEVSRMTTLLELHGVGMPTASTLLYSAFPDDYPILDVRALESLGVTSRGHYSVGFWLQYLDTCRALARSHGVTLRTLDKALWQYSKEKARDATAGVSPAATSTAPAARAPGFIIDGSEVPGPK
jgi:hypothetical protein